MGNTLNASSITVARQDGLRHTDPATWLEYVQSNNQKFVNGLIFKGSSFYPERVASVLLLGLNEKDGKLVPAFYDINISALQDAVGKADAQTSIPANEQVNASRPISAMYRDNVQLTGMNATTASLIKMNGVFPNVPTIPYAGAMAQSSKLRKPSLQACWSDNDKTYAKWSSSSAYETYGITELTFLFYMNEVVDYMCYRYGYKVPRNREPYSYLNWLKVSDNGGNTTSARYYKILVLTETDLYLHMDITSRPSLLTKEFALSAAFTRMVNSVSNMSQDVLRLVMNDNVFHPQMLTTGQRIDPGQYLYSKDLKYKLHLHSAGYLNIWKLPITDASVPTTKVTGGGYSMPPGGDGISCFVELSTNGQTSIIGSSGGSTGLMSFDFAPLAANYRMLVTAGGAFVVTTSGVRDRLTPVNDKTDVYYVKDSDFANRKSTNDPMDPECVNGWLNIADRTNPSASRTGPFELINNSMCYSSPFVTRNDASGVNASRFLESDMQMIIYQVGYAALNQSQKTFGEAFAFINGPLIAKAIELGFKLPANVYNYVNYAYCTRGDRLATDPNCASSINSLRNVSGAYRSTIDNKARTVLCDSQYNDKYAKFCSVWRPNTIKSDIQSLIRINKEFSTLLQTNNEPGVYNPFLQNVGAIMTMSTGFTTADLDFIFNRIQPSYYPKWQELYAKAASTTPFPTYDGFTKFIRTTMFKQKDMLSIVISFFKTTEGMIGIVGTGEFPYTTMPTSFDKNDVFLKRMLVTGSIMDISKWAGPNFVPMTATDISIFAGNESKTLFGGLMDIKEIDITSGGTKIANAYVFYRTTDVDKAIKYIRTLNTVKEEVDRVTYPTGLCATIPDACFPEALTYVQTKSFDNISNNWCDLASSTITRNDDIGYLSGSSAQSLLNACNSSYATDQCIKPENRYKSKFSQKVIRPGKALELFSHIPSVREPYTGSSSCIDICNTSQTGTALFDACKQGSIDYCKQDENIINDTCIREATKFPEVKILADNWCVNNPTHPKYSTICKPTQTNVVDTTTVNQGIISQPSVVSTSTTAVIPSSTVPSSASTIIEVSMNPLNELSTIPVPQPSSTTQTTTVVASSTSPSTGGTPPAAQKSAKDIQSELQQSSQPKQTAPSATTPAKETDDSSINVIVVIMYFIIFIFLGAVAIASMVSKSKPTVAKNSGMAWFRSRQRAHLQA